MSKIGVVGWYGHGNCGDESYKLSFPKVFPQHEFVFGDNEKIPQGADAYILGGGDVVCKQFINALKPIENKHIISATMSSQEKGIVDFKTVAVRDVSSLGNAASCGVHAKYIPDFAFALDSDATRGKELIKSQFKFVNHDLYSKIVVVVMNTHLIPEHNGLARDLFAFHHVTTELGKAMDGTDASFLFVPFGKTMPWDDRIANSWASSRCKWWKKNCVAYDALSVQDTIDMIAAADAVISTRLHSTIFSCLTATPFIDLTHGHKNRGFLETTGLMNRSMNYYGVEHEALVNKLKMSIGSNQVKDELRKVTAKQKMILKEFAQNVHLV